MWLNIFWCYQQVLFRVRSSRFLHWAILKSKSEVLNQELGQLNVSRNEQQKCNAVHIYYLIVYRFYFTIQSIRLRVLRILFCILKKNRSGFFSGSGSNFFNRNSPKNNYLIFTFRSWRLFILHNEARNDWSCLLFFSQFSIHWSHK